MTSRFRRLLPDRERIQANRWLRWLGPSLMHPRLWHFSRRGVAVGVSLGVFFGLLIPIAQIPFATGMAVLMRANVPAAAASTLVTNPVTFAPVYLLAHQVGSALLGEPEAPADVAPVAPATPVAPVPSAAPARPVAAAPSAGSTTPVASGWWSSAFHGVLALGKPLLLAYGLIMLVWRVKTTLQWKRRRRS